MKDSAAVIICITALFMELTEIQCYCSKFRLTMVMQFFLKKHFLPLGWSQLPKDDNLFSYRENLVEKRKQYAKEREETGPALASSTHDSFAELDSCNDERRHSSCTNNKQEPADAVSVRQLNSWN
jgi:hypothetical protein